MSVFDAFHAVVPLPGRRGGSLRAPLARVAARLAASPLDSPVLHAIAAPIPAEPTPADAPSRLHARWRPVTAADGRTRLVADWCPDR
ncbi:hypothetical protein [Kitasatospora sp. LaBMicrA B282]|uniref:hypothetical protein n=1 Tax=Kitasatospora sp. LaBMicrA B282 TaxID=3420949 RepID=UPI003D0D5B99